MRIGTRTGIENLVEALLHELVHCACPLNVHHGELFCRRLIATAREAFGLKLDTAVLLAMPSPSRRLAYTIDAEIKKAMQEAKVGEQVRKEVPFVAPSPEPRETVDARLNHIRQERKMAKQSHCEAMLAEHQSKLAREKKLVAKWQKKVNYYIARQ